MSEVLDFFVTLWSFIWALISNWILYMTAFPLILDDLIKWCSPKVSSWIEAKLSGTKRRKAEIYLMFSGLFVASFMAFDGEHMARTKAESDNQTLSKQLVAMSPSGQEEQIKKLEKTVELQRISHSELSVKQQQEIDSLKKAANPLAAPIVSGTATIEIIYALPPNQLPTNGTTVGEGQICFGLGDNSLLMAATEAFPREYSPGDGTEHSVFNCSIISGVQSPYLGKSVSSLRDAQFIQIEQNIIPKTISILSGNVRWVINGAVPINYAIPAQPQTDSRIFIRDLSDGIKQLSSVPDKSISPP